MDCSRLAEANAGLCREELREQHAIGEEINEALTQGAVGNMDEDELEEELEGLQQEELDNKMLRTGTVPVADEVHRLPNVASGEGELIPSFSFSFCSCVCNTRGRVFWLTFTSASAVKGKAPARQTEEDDYEEELRKLQAEMAM